MKLKHYFLLLAAAIVLLAVVALLGTFRAYPRLFYFTEVGSVLLLAYLGYFYRKTIRPYDTLIGGMELVRDLDLTTRLAPSGQHETDVIVRTFNELLSRLRREHLQLEEQYSFLTLLIEASPMGIVQCNLDGDITSMNPAAREMLSPNIEEAMRKLALDEVTTVRQTGAPQLFRISHLSFPDRGYQHPFYLIEALTAEVHQAEKAAYERIIRMIAHEVNNSVAGIIGSLPEEESGRLLALSKFVTRFAEVVKLPQPQMQLCDLSEEVEACQPFLENLCFAANVRLNLCLTDEAIPVRLDTVLFQQVLINIVKNAVESISESGVQGLITITSTPSQLVVTDNGKGIEPSVSPHLFTPFFSTKPQGQGLGLLLIRDILSAHHCVFSLLTSSDDHLTRFTIQFPTL